MHAIDGFQVIERRASLGGHAERLGCKREALQCLCILHGLRGVEGDGHRLVIQMHTIDGFQVIERRASLGGHAERLGCKREALQCLCILHGLRGVEGDGHRLVIQMHAIDGFQVIERRASLCGHAERLG